LSGWSTEGAAPLSNTGLWWHSQPPGPSPHTGEGKILHIEIFLSKSAEMLPAGPLWGVLLTKAALGKNQPGTRCRRQAAVSDNSCCRNAPTFRRELAE